MNEDIKKILADALKAPVGDRVVEYHDYRSKYTILKPSVTLKAETRDGKVIVLDVTDLFEKGGK